MFLTRAVSFLLCAVHTLAFPLVSLLTAGKLTTAPLDRVPPSHYTSASITPCDPAATPAAHKLMAYLQAQYGSCVLSGQFVDPFQDYSQPQFRDAEGRLDARLTNELAAIAENNGGKYPAVLGLDFTGVEFASQWDDWTTQQALQWHSLGGIVTYCWHWGVPADITKAPAEWSRWESAIHPEDTNFDLKAALADKNSTGYQWLLASIKNAAAQLAVLQDAGVPVLWRPLHEAAGGWFWWGSAGKDAYLELYNLLYDKLVNEYGLHNLIWVWNGQNPAWYPGDDRADILSDDPYGIANVTWLYPLDPARATRFKYTRRASAGKMVAMSENDVLPSLDQMWAMNTKWLFFCTWNREMVLLPDPNDRPYGVLRQYSEKYNSVKALRAVYNDARVLTLDEITLY